MFMCISCVKFYFLGFSSFQFPGVHLCHHTFLCCLLFFPVSHSHLFPACHQSRCLQYRIIYIYIYIFSVFPAPPQQCMLVSSHCLGFFVGGGFQSLYVCCHVSFLFGLKINPVYFSEVSQVLSAFVSFHQPGHLCSKMKLILDLLLLMCQ